jgi:hypothetical protein
VEESADKIAHYRNDIDDVEDTQKSEDQDVEDYSIHRADDVEEVSITPVEANRES